MIYSIFPTKDATLYEKYETQNTGLDSILEINNGLSDDGSKLKYNTRILLKFDFISVIQNFHAVRYLKFWNL